MKNKLACQIPLGKNYLEMSLTDLVCAVREETDPGKQELQMAALRTKSRVLRRSICLRTGLKDHDLDDGDTATFLKMMDLVPRFRRDRAQFHTYAFRHLQSAARDCREETYLIRRPSAHHEDSGRLQRFLSDWESTHGKPLPIPGNEIFIARQLGFTLPRLQNAFIVKHCSLDSENAEGHSIASTIGIEGEEPCRTDGDDRAYLLRRAMTRLTDREIIVLEARHGFGGDGPMTPAEISKALGLTRQRVRQIQEKAEARLLSIIATMQKLEEIAPSAPITVEFLNGACHNADHRAVDSRFKTVVAATIKRSAAIAVRKKAAGGVA
jgi:RNA polymerase sigma factor (sigma-70 family)